jgi:hypothetical protein
MGTHDSVWSIDGYENIKFWIKIMSWGRISTSLDPQIDIISYCVMINESSALPYKREFVY